MDNLPTVSVIVPTRDRVRDLANLLPTILDQSYLPLEVIIVDDSPGDSTKQIFYSFGSKFRSVGCELKYVRGSDDGLPAARNLGVKVSRGDVILFLDDDTLLDRNVVGASAAFLRDKPIALGVQPKILSTANNKGNERLAEKLENAIYKAFMLTHHDKNVLVVRRSGASVFPSTLTNVISVQRLSGCCCCYRREVFNESSFDINLKRCGSMEDLDFSHRIYEKNPQSLFAIPYTKIIHKKSGKAGLATRQNIYMTTVYWVYVFFKDVFKGSFLNLMAFLWALTGNLVTMIGGLIVKRKPKCQWWKLVYLVNSYLYALRYLRKIEGRYLGFFNKRLER